MIRRLSVDEARSISPVNVPAPAAAESLRERLAGARREQALRSELEEGLRARLPALLRQLVAAQASEAELERRTGELLDDLFRSSAP